MACLAVTYGGMAKQALSIPPSLFIFKKLTLSVSGRPITSRSSADTFHSAGFWLSDWVKSHPTERLAMMNDLAQLMADGKLRAPETETVDLVGLGAEEVGETVRGVMERLEEGRGRKVLLKFSD